jgi:hypothetical protein
METQDPAPLQLLGDYPYTYFVHARPESLELLRREMAAAQKKFQYFFLFPYHLL